MRLHLGVAILERAWQRLYVRSMHYVVHLTNPLYNLEHLIRRDAMALTLWQLSPQEHVTVEKLAHARTAAARLDERARIILLVPLQG
jgi:hypothetical protein